MRTSHSQFRYDRDDVKSVEKDISHIKELVGEIRSSTKRREIFEKKRLKLDEDQTKLPCLDVATRWSSNFEMLKTVIFSRSVPNSVSNSLT